MGFIIPFLISALMGMGVGGGGLLIIYLTLFLNTPQLIAQGTNLLLFVIAGLGSLFFHFRKRKIVIWQVVLGISFGALGSLLSSLYLSQIDPKYAKICLGALLIISGVMSLYNTLIKRVWKKFKKTLYK
ncbi:MAG: TSUP family transporter [Clostridia bacterium]|nr:TSUP family transporter [Clostridia bacterium]